MLLRSSRLSSRLLALPGLLCVACALPAGAPPAAEPTALATASPVAKPQASTVPPLSARQQQLADQLAAHVDAFTAERRTSKDPEWVTASLTDWLAARLEGMGYEVTRQGFSHGDGARQNIQVELRGKRRGYELVMIGAHFGVDSGASATDDNASGVATVLALANTFAGMRPDRTMRFVFFANGAGTQPNARDGSAHAVAELGERARALTLMLNIDSIGHYDDGEGTQRFPDGVGAGRDTIGDFVAVIGNSGSRDAYEPFLRALTDATPLEVAGFIGDAEDDFFRGSDHQVFWDSTLRSLWLTDTARYRGRGAPPETTVGGPDTARMAHLVTALEDVIIKIAGPFGEPTATDATDEPALDTTVQPASNDLGPGLVPARP